MKGGALEVVVEGLRLIQSGGRAMPGFAGPNTGTDCARAAAVALAKRLKPIARERNLLFSFINFDYAYYSGNLRYL